MGHIYQVGWQLSRWWEVGLELGGWGLSYVYSVWALASSVISDSYNSIGGKTEAHVAGAEALRFAAKSLQSCLTLCDPRDGNLPGSSVPGILQARTLEWITISFSNSWEWKVKVKSLSHVWLFMTPWTTAHQAPPPMGFSRQEYWSRVPLSSLRAEALRFEAKLILFSLCVYSLFCNNSLCLTGKQCWSERDRTECMAHARVHMRWMALGSW